MLGKPPRRRLPTSSEVNVRGGVVRINVHRNISAGQRAEMVRAIKASMRVRRRAYSAWERALDAGKSPAEAERILHTVNDKARSLVKTAAVHGHRASAHRQHANKIRKGVSKKVAKLNPGIEARGHGRKARWLDS